MTTREEQLEQQLAETTAQMQQMMEYLKGMGFNPPQPQAEDVKRKDYIGFGTPEHASFLGIHLVDDEGTLVDGDITFRSSRTKDLYRLIDPIQAFIHYPDPEQAAVLTLRQKVACFEAGPPPVPPDAPPLWVPRDTM